MSIGCICRHDVPVLKILANKHIDEASGQSAILLCLATEHGSQMRDSVRSVLLHTSCFRSVLALC